MAGIAPAPHPAPDAKIASQRQFATIAWLRWRIFVNSLRSKGAKGELAARVLSYPFLALMVLGPSMGAGFASFYLVNSNQVSLLALPLWGVFILWQFIGINTSATGPSFDLSSLIRFPIRYRDYLLIRLSFGLMDPPTLAGIGCLAGMCLGISIADPTLFLWSALLLVLYALCNIFFSRMIYLWMERWLAQRRTRELLTGVILAVSLGAQFISQYAQRLSHHGHHEPVSPFLKQAFDIVVAINWLLPPGLAATSIDHIHNAEVPIAVAALGGLLLFTAAFLLILHVRLHAQYLGEDLSEAPGGVSKKYASTLAKTSIATVSTPSAFSALLSATVVACMRKEIRYLLRSGPKLYVLIMPVFVVFLFSARNSGMQYAGVSRHNLNGMLFCYGCAYTQLIFVSLIYNSLGSDGSGSQFYFIAPLRMRDVMLAKNLLIFCLFAIEAALIYIASAFITAPSPLDLTVATLAWSLFTLFIGMTIGNVRSITAPKAMDPGRVRSQNVNGMSSVISLVVVGGSVALGGLMAFLCRFLQTSYWIATAIFSVLAICAFVAYRMGLNKLDSVAATHVESLTQELTKV